MTAADAMVPTTPQFAALKRVLERWDAAKTALDEARMDEEALGREAHAIAMSIRLQNVEDGNFALAPTFMESRSIEKVDADRIRLNHPDIYDRCNPHISKNGMGTMLQAIHTPDELQQMFRDMDRDRWYELSSITKADLKNAVSDAEWRMLEEEQAIYTEVKFTGEIRLVNKHFQAALDAQHEFGKEPEEED